MKNAGPQYSCLVVDAHPLVRDGIKRYLEETGILGVVAEASDLDAALYAARQHQPDLVVVSATLAGSDPIQFVTMFAAEFAEIAIVVCNVSMDQHLINTLFSNGAMAIVSSEALPNEYTAASFAALANGRYISASMSDGLNVAQTKGARGDTPYGLTEREMVVLKLLADGLSNKEIARELNLSVRTAETHRLNIRRKTEASSLSQLIKIAKSVGATGLDVAKLPSTGGKEQLVRIGRENSGVLL